MLRKSVLAAVATVGAFGLAGPSAGSAQAAGAYLTPLGAPSILSNAIEVKSDKGKSKGGASKSGQQQSPQQFKSGLPVQQQFKAGPQLVPQQVDPQHPKKKWIAPGNIPKDVSWTRTDDTVTMAVTLSFQSGLHFTRRTPATIGSTARTGGAITGTMIAVRCGDLTQS